MIVTVDLDNSNYRDVKVVLELAKHYGLQLMRINKSYSKTGYHLVFYIHKTKLQFLNILDVPKQFKQLVRQRYLEITQYTTDKLAVLRYILGDDLNRILLDLAKENMPKQVLFTNYYGRDR